MADQIPEEVAGDESNLRHAEETLRSITEGTAAATGGDFFTSLVRHLAKALHTRYSFVAECTDETRTEVRTLAFWSTDRFAEDITFRVRGTPCEKVIGGDVCCYPQSLQSLFPEDTGLVRLQAESYLGVPLYGSTGKVLGHLVVIDDKPMADSITRDIPILRIFAARAGAELELKYAGETSSDEPGCSHGFRSLCALPLIVRNKSIGAITVGSLTRFQYQQSDADFLMDIANQIAIAIDNMRAYDDLRRLSGELGALLDVNRAISQHLERDALFGALAGCLQNLLPTDRFGIELPIGDGKLQGHLLSPQDGLSQHTEPHVMPAAGTACNWSLETRQWLVTASREELRQRFPVTFEVMTR